MKKENMIGKYMNYKCNGLDFVKAIFLCTILFGLAAHSYAFLNFTISHDSLGALHSLDGGKIQLGRFGVVVYKFITGSFVTLPWSAGVFCLIFVGMANVLICRIFHLDKLWQIILVSGILITNITITSLVSTYMHDLGADTFALLMSVVSAYAWNEIYRHSSKKLLYTSIGIVSMVTALSIYQSYLSVTTVIILFVLLLDLLEGEKFVPVMKSGLFAVACILVSCLLYLVLALSACYLSKLDMITSSYNSLSNIANSSITFESRLYTAYFNLLTSFVKAPVSSLRYPLVSIMNCILLCFTFYIITKKWWKIGIKEKAVSVVLLVLTPFAMNISGFLDGMSHALMIYALWLSYIPIVKLISRENNVEIALGRKIGHITVMALIGFIIVANIQTANTVYLKKDVERQATISRVTSMIEMIEQQENYVYGETPVALLGYPLDNEKLMLAEGNIGTLTGSGFVNQITYYGVWQSYLINVLNYKMNLCQEEQIYELWDHPEVMEMPCFPNNSSIKMINGIIVVKFSEI